MPASKPDSATTTKSTSQETSTPAPVRRERAWQWRSALAGGLISASVLGGGVLVWQRPDPPPIVVHPPPMINSSGPSGELATSVLTSVLMPTPTPVPATIMVFVSGAVVAPGLYELPPNARVADALVAANGLTDAAHPDVVNQAAPLRDGDQVHVPTYVEVPAEPPAGISSIPVENNEAGPLDVNRPINVNTASASELDQLPGIGPVRAADIIANRPYATVDELDRVPGIGTATLEQLRPYVTVE